MVDSTTVLWGQTLVYTAYCCAISLLIGWFAMRLTREPGAEPVIPAKAFYSLVAVLVTAGVSLHLITYSTIPWVSDDLHGDAVTAERTYAITVKDHTFTLEAPQLVVPCGKVVRFSVTSEDLTYGFGLFRSDNSMVAQMQVVPGHPNNLVWTFGKEGVYSIRSTEYSGPRGDQMIVKDAVKVSGCATAGS